MGKTGLHVVTMLQFVRLLSAFTLAAVLSVFAPSMLNHPPVNRTLQDPAIGERVAGTEVRLANLEGRVTALEAEKIGEQIAELRTRLEWFGIPVTLFILAQTAEIMQRLRGKAKTRSTD